MADLDTQLRSLADHRLALVPERAIETPSDPPPLPEPPGRRARLLVAAAVLALVAAGLTLWSRNDPSEPVVAVDPPEGVPDMADRSVVERTDWTAPLGRLDTPATFVVARVGEDVEIQAAVPDRAQVRYRPASTFKLLNALMFQEAGVAADLQESVVWDGVDRGIAAWNRDHTLASALEVSAVWVFEELAGRMGVETTARLVSDAEYGNADIGDGAGAYWLDGAIRISAIEQLAFLEDLVLGTLPFDPQDQADLIGAMTSERLDGASIHYKTGTALAGPDPVAWLVGIVKAPTATHVFAFNADLAVVDGEPQGLSSQERVDLVVELLTTAGIVG